MRGIVTKPETGKRKRNPVPIWVLPIRYSIIDKAGKIQNQPGGYLKILKLLRVDEIECAEIPHFWTLKYAFSRFTPLRGLDLL